MNTNLKNISGEVGRRIRRRPVRFLAGAGVILAVGALAYALLTGRGGSDADTPLAPVRRGPLTVSVSETGTIQNRERVVVKSEVEGSVQILWLIEEGTTVEKGDLLVELDSSSLQDQEAQQQISVQNAEAAFIRARENLAVTRSQAESDIAQAELNVRFAELDLRKYLEGEWPRELRKAESDITLASEELQRAEDELDWSRRLEEDKYITRTELQADELACRRAQIQLELARNNLEVLTEYTHERTVAQLRSDVEQAHKALERVKRKAGADVIQAEADFKARESEFRRQRDKLAKINDQIAKCRITAPVSGMVVYATTGQGNWRGNAEPLDEGQQIRERQELIHMPTTAQMMAEVKVHESSLRKIERGMPVRITVDAMPGATFWGRVSKIALLPDAQSAWLNPDLKVYNTEVDVLGDGSALRPGMTCRAEIIVEQYEDALYVPVQSIVRVGGQPVAYVMTSGGTERRAVEIGLDNNRQVRVLAGLTEGELVMLSPPLAPSETPFEAGEGAPGVEVPAGTTPPAEEADGKQQEAGETPEMDFSKLREMTPQQRQEWLESLTDEQREQLQQQMRERFGGQDGGRRPGGAGGGPRGGGAGGGRGSR